MIQSIRQNAGSRSVKSAWIVPAISRLSAGSARNGVDNVMPDGGTSFSS